MKVKTSLKSYFSTLNFNKIFKISKIWDIDIKNDFEHYKIFINKGTFNRVWTEFRSPIGDIVSERDNVPVQAPTQGQPLTVITRNCPISFIFYEAHGDAEDVFSS